LGNLVELLSNSAARLPKHTALIFGDNKIDYGLLFEASKRLAHGLKDLGIRKGDRVAIMLPNVPHFCISYYGILQLGATVVPINIMYNKDEIQYELQDSGASLLITWTGFQSQAIPAAESSPECKNILFLGDNIPKGTIALTRIISESSPLDEPITIKDTDLALINYTSGVADAPLGASLTHNSLYSNAVTCSEMFRLSEDDKIIAVLPLFHPLGQTLVLNASISTSSTIVLMPRYTPEEIVNAIAQNGVTFMAAVPGIFRNLIDINIGDNPLPTLKYCMSYGGKLSTDLLEEFEARYNTFVLNAYGLTEAGPLVTSTRLDRERKTGSVGLPLFGVEIQIRDELGNILRPLHNGEIWTKSPNIMQNYYNNPVETNKRLKDGWLFTGDIGYLDDSHHLYIQERKENIIVKGGFQIFPHEVEKVIMAHSDIEEAAVIDVPDQVQGSEVKAFIVLKESKKLSPEDIVKFCRHTLPVYKTPRYIEFCSGLPKSPTGRILKRLLHKKSDKQTAVKIETINIE